MIDQKKSALVVLDKYRACNEAIEWVGERTVEEAWAECPRGDWMLWIYAKMYPTNIKEITLAKGHCANTVRHLLRDERSIQAIDIAIAFGEGRDISLKQLNEAAYQASYAAYDAASSAATFAFADYASASSAAAYAAYAVSAASDAASDAASYAASYAAYAVSDVASAAVSKAAAVSDAATHVTHVTHEAHDAAVSSAVATRAENHLQTANVCREILNLCI